MKQFTYTGSIGCDIVHMEGNPDTYTKSYSFGTITYENDNRKYIVKDVELIAYPVKSPVDNKNVYKWDTIKSNYRDTTPDTQSNFNNITNADISSIINTSTFTITEINDYVSVSISPMATLYVNGEVKPNGFEVQEDDVIYFAVTTNSNQKTTDNYTVTIGTETKNFSVTTKDIDPKRSCKELFDDGNTTNGNYIVKPFLNDDREITVYCDMANGGWMQIDNNFPYYSGRECSSGWGNIDSNGNWRLNIDELSAHIYGSGTHSGCGISTNKPLLFTDVKLTDMSIASDKNCGSVLFPNARFGIIIDNDGPVSTLSNYNYPGWNYESIDGSIIDQNRIAYPGVSGVRTQSAPNGKGEYFLHFGIGAYRGCYNRSATMKVWVK